MLRGQGRAVATRRFRESPQCHLASFSALVCSVSGLGWFELQRQGMLPVSGEVTVSMTGNCSFRGSQPLSLPCLASIPRGRPPPRCLGALAVVQRGTDCSSLTGLFSSGRSQMRRTQNRNCRKAWLAGGEGDQERGNQDSKPRPPCAPLCGSSSDPPRRPAWEPGCSRSVWLQPLQHLLAMNKDGVAEAGLGVGAGGRSI